MQEISYDVQGDNIEWFLWNLLEQLDIIIFKWLLRSNQ